MKHSEMTASIHHVMQTTIRTEINTSGVGVHSGRHASIRLRPAPANTGILFHRIDVGEDGFVLAHAQNAIETQLCTTIKNQHGIEVRMIEHLMAAFQGVGVDNVIIEIDGPEVPIFDGSSKMIVELLHYAGIESLDAPRYFIEVMAPVRVELDNGAWAELSQAESLQLDIDIAFDDPGIGQQSLLFDMADEAFGTEIAHARTFCVYADVETMRRAGFAKGGSLENAIVYRDGALMNEGGLRMEDECVKHKALDCIGDLFLLGMPIKGRLTSHKPGHRLSTLLVQALLADESAYRITSYDDFALTNTGTDAVALAVSA